MSLIGKLKRVARASGFKGGIEGVAGGVVFGWAVSGRQPERPAEVGILVDGVVIGRVPTTLVRPDIALAAPSGHRCGFRFDLRPHLREFSGQQLSLCDPESRVPFGGKALSLHRADGFGAIDAVHGLEIRGWAVVLDPEVELTEIEVRLDGEIAGTAVADQPRPDLKQAGVPRLKSGFRFYVPRRWQDGADHAVTATVKGASTELRNGGLSFRALIKGHVDHFSRERVAGWITNVEAPNVPIRFDLWLNGHCIKQNLSPAHRRDDVASSLFHRALSADAAFGFDLALPESITWESDVNTVALCEPGEVVPLLEGQTAVITQDAVIDAMERLAAALNQPDPAGDFGPQWIVNSLLRIQYLPTILAQLRTGAPGMTTLLSDPRIGIPVVHGDDTRRRPVDVVIPVYKGYAETMDCIRSVLRTRDETPMNLVVINDYSPDGRIVKELRLMAVSEKFTFIENDRNLGFVASVNKGMRLHADRDVVLLNSDTVVPSGWLTRLQRAAYSSTNIGTVTPLSNRATIFSLPRTCVDNDMPEGFTVDDLDALCAEHNAGEVVDVPTAMGFCMYIRRDLLREIGDFDEERWAKGYAEENDFSMRAAGRGWRNVAACDVFVEHHGAVSFEGDKAPRVAENLAKLNVLYPDYSNRIQRFIKADPIAAARGRISAAMLRRAASSYILFVTHGLGGGTDTAIRDLCALHGKAGRQVLILRSKPSGTLELAPAAEKCDDLLISQYPQGIPAEDLASILKILNVEYVHYHHSLGFRTDIWSLPELLGVPYDVAVHDFYLVCPRITLIDDSGVFCGQPQLSACERCVQAGKIDHDADLRLADLGGSVEAWRAYHAERLRGARRILAPSEDARARVLRYLPGISIEAVPHPEPAFVFKQRPWDGNLPYKVAVIGAIGPHKGVDVLLNCARYALRRSIPIEFVVIGYTSRDEAFAKLENVVITGKYQPDELPDLIAEHHCTVALFISIWPETFSYTLSEAWRNGLVPVAFDLGAPAERIRQDGIGQLVPFPSDPETIVQALLTVATNAAADPPTNPPKELAEDPPEKLPEARSSEPPEEPAFPAPFSETIVE